MTTMYLISFFAVVIAVAFAAYLAMWVKRQNLGNARIEQIGKLIRDGANTFMRREYKLLACFAGVVAVLILIFLPRPFWSEGANFLDNVKMVIAYVAGTVMSAITGKLGVYVATLANTRAARAAMPTSVSTDSTASAPSSRFCGFGSASRRSFEAN